MFKTSLGRLRIIAFLEGISFLLLVFIAVPLKYWAGMPTPTQILGMAHGALFVLYILFLIQVVIDLGWNFQKTALGLLASVVPFGTFYADAKLFKPHASKK